MSEIFASPPRAVALAGGLPLVVVGRPGPRVLAARLVIRGGSGADPRHGRGAHQLLAGLMTRGCGALDAEALADLVEGAGAALRAEARGPKAREPRGGNSLKSARPPNRGFYVFCFLCVFSCFSIF